MTARLLHGPPLRDEDGDLTTYAELRRRERGDMNEYEVERTYLVHIDPAVQERLVELQAALRGMVYPDLVAATRATLDMTGKPYVIENVMSAPLLRDRSIVLCGGMFGLRTYRHRRFESTIAGLVTAPEHPKHVIRTATKQRRLRWAEGWHVSITGDVGTYLGPEAMGIDWMTGNELCEAIPPAYTEWIGARALALRDEAWDRFVALQARHERERLDHARALRALVPDVALPPGTTPTDDIKEGSDG